MGIFLRGIGKVTMFTTYLTCTAEILLGGHCSFAHAYFWKYTNNTSI